MIIDYQELDKSFNNYSEEFKTENKKWLVNTRPADQAGQLSVFLDQCGYNVLEMPLMTIVPLPDKISPEILQHYQLLIFISANAVTHFYQQFDQEITMQVAVIGQATAERFAQFSHRKADFIPKSGNDSESLLSEFKHSDINQKNILIVRGKGGRDYLAEQLRKKGAQTTYMEIYQRLSNNFNGQFLSGLWKQFSIGCMLIYSSESLINLIEQVRQSKMPDLLKLITKTPLMVIHPKIKIKAEQLGFNSRIEIFEANNYRQLNNKLQRCLQN